jgi:hypothetical protein
MIEDAVTEHRGLTITENANASELEAVPIPRPSPMASTRLGRILT